MVHFNQRIFFSFESGDIHVLLKHYKVTSKPSNGTVNSTINVCNHPSTNHTVPNNSTSLYSFKPHPWLLLNIQSSGSQPSSVSFCGKEAEVCIRICKLSNPKSLLHPVEQMPCLQHSRKAMSKFLKILTLTTF